MKNVTRYISNVSEKYLFLWGECGNFCPEEVDSMPRTNDNNLPNITASHPNKRNCISSKKLQEMLCAVLPDVSANLSLSLYTALFITVSVHPTLLLPRTRH